MFGFVRKFVYNIAKDAVKDFGVSERDVQQRINDLEDSILSDISNKEWDWKQECKDDIVDEIDSKYEYEWKDSLIDTVRNDFLGDLEQDMNDLRSDCNLEGLQLELESSLDSRLANIKDSIKDDIKVEVSKDEVENLVTVELDKWKFSRRVD